MTELTTLFGSPVVPVVVIEDPAAAVPLAHALLAGGIDCAEVTLRTPAALECIRRMAAETDIVVGAGTVKCGRDAEAAIEAGARFAVSPGVSRDVVALCLQAQVPVLPGAVTATEVMAALELGVRLLKFFPAASSGGPKAVSALAGPFAEVSFVPTGGVTVDNLRDYLALPNVTAVGGTWLTPAGCQRNGDFTPVTTLARMALTLASGASS
ncbi:MAG: bifunctional 4-hydroxy-2-oxoglutarate aldolase/2-dehydro-3-deoxy-phosphogluconate aldolase [Motilibacteraceae bacterium]